MTLTKMNELYEKGMYSPINYYLGLVALLEAGEDIETVMANVPEPLRPQILEIATRRSPVSKRS